MINSITTFDQFISAYPHDKTHQDKLNFIQQMGISLHDLITNSGDLFWLFEMVKRDSDAKGLMAEIASQIDRRIIELIPNTYALELLIKDLHKPGQEIVVNKIHEYLPVLITNKDTLINILKLSDHTLHATILAHTNPDTLKHIIAELRNEELLTIFSYLKDEKAQHIILNKLAHKIKNFSTNGEEKNEWYGSAYEECLYQIIATLSDINKQRFIQMLDDDDIVSVMHNSDEESIIESFKSAFQIQEKTKFKNVMDQIAKYCGDHNQLHLQLLNRLNQVYRKDLEEDRKQHRFPILEYYYSTECRPFAPAKYFLRSKQIDASWVLEHVLRSSEPLKYLARLDTFRKDFDYVFLGIIIKQVKSLMAAVNNETKINPPFLCKGNSI